MGIFVYPTKQLLFIFVYEVGACKRRERVSETKLAAEGSHVEKAASAWDVDSIMDVSHHAALTFY